MWKTSSGRSSSQKRATGRAFVADVEECSSLLLWVLDRGFLPSFLHAHFTWQYTTGSSFGLHRFA